MAGQTPTNPFTPNYILYFFYSGEWEWIGNFDTEDSANAFANEYPNYCSMIVRNETKQEPKVTQRAVSFNPDSR